MLPDADSVSDPEVPMVLRITVATMRTIHSMMPMW
jgi:hypothetical protein